MRDRLSIVKLVGRRYKIGLYKFLVQIIMYILDSRSIAINVFINRK